MRGNNTYTQFLVAEQFPSLETLSIYHPLYDFEGEALDMSGCKKFKHLALSGYITVELLWDAPSSGFCPLTFAPQEGFPIIAEYSSVAHKRQAALTQHLSICQ